MDTKYFMKSKYIMKWPLEQDMLHFLKKLVYEEKFNEEHDLYTFDMNPKEFIENYFHVNPKRKSYNCKVQWKLYNWLLENLHNINWEIHNALIMDLSLYDFVIEFPLDGVSYWKVVPKYSWEDIDKWTKEYLFDQLHEYWDTFWDNKTFLKNFIQSYRQFFNQNLGIYSFVINTKKRDIWLKILQENPPYICGPKVVNYILKNMKDVDILDIEGTIKAGQEYIFDLVNIDMDKNREYYIKWILTSTYENTAKLLDYLCKDPLLEKEKRENLKNLIEAFEENFAFVDSEKYKKNDKNFPHLYWNIAYNDKENRVIKWKVWEYNFKNSTLYIDTDTGRKIVNLTDADNPRILVEAILKSPNFYVHKSDFAFEPEKTLSNLKTNNMWKNWKVDKKYYWIFYTSNWNIWIRKDFEPKENPK